MSVTRTKKSPKRVRQSWLAALALEPLEARNAPLSLLDVVGGGGIAFGGLGLWDPLHAEAARSNSSDVVIVRPTASFSDMASPPAQGADSSLASPTPPPAGGSDAAVFIGSEYAGTETPAALNPGDPSSLNWNQLFAVFSSAAAAKAPAQGASSSADAGAVAQPTGGTNDTSRTDSAGLSTTALPPAPASQNTGPVAPPPTAVANGTDAAPAGAQTTTAPATAGTPAAPTTGGTIAGQTSTTDAHAAHGELLAKPPELTPAQAAQQQAGLDHRHSLPPIAETPGLAPVPTNAPATDAKSPVTATGTGPGDSPPPPASTDFTYYRFSQVNTNGSFNSSSVGEPNPGSIGRVAFQTGNWYASVSGNYGSDFGYINPYTTFPATGDYSGGFCCDQRVATDRRFDGDPALGNGMVAWYLQYNNTGGTTNDVGGVRIAVANKGQNLLDNAWTYYNFTSQSFGQGRGWSMDFPQMQVSNNYLYASSNMYGIGRSGFESVMWRIPLADLYAGGSIGFTYWIVTTGNSLAFTNNAGGTMYAASYPGATSLRIFSQPEANTGLSFVDRGVATTYGGTHTEITVDGTNWTGRSDERVQTGWVAGNDVGFMWNSAGNPSAPAGTYASHPFLRTAIFDSGLNLVSQPDIWNGSYAWHYGAIAVNDRNEIAGPVFVGGATFAPEINMVIRDYVNGYWGVYGAVGGTGAVNNAWGDYLGAARHQRYGSTWIASGYVKSGTTIIPYYFWFGREFFNPNRLSGFPHIGNNIATAQSTFINESGSYNLTTALWDPTYGRRNVHIYRLQAKAGGVLTAQTSLPPNGDITDTILRLFDHNGTQLAVDDDGGGAPYSRIVYTFSDADTYYVGVSGYANFSYNANIAGSGSMGNQATYPSYGDYRLDLQLTAAAATTNFLVAAPPTTTAGSPYTFTVTARTATNATNPYYRGTVFFSSPTDGLATFSPTSYTFTAADNGVHTFTNGATFRTAGAQTLRAADGGIVGNTSVTVSPATLDHLGVTTSVATTQAGSPFDVTVTAQDAYNNTITGYAGTVTFTSADPYPAVLPADYTFGPGDNGSHTFSGGATLFTSGTYDVTATDTGDASITGTRNVNVVAAAAVTYVISAPSDVSAGTAFTITVTAQDAYGNVATGYGGTATFSSSDGDPGVLLPADYPFQPADAGSASFSVTLQTVGPQTVTATDTVDGTINNTVSVNVS